MPRRRIPGHTSGPTSRSVRPVVLGLRANLAQFGVLVAVNALVGGMIGQERTVLPLLAEEDFGRAVFSTVRLPMNCRERLVAWESVIQSKI